MLKNYLKIALRNINRYKGYSLLNVIGLAITKVPQFAGIIRFSTGGHNHGADFINVFLAIRFDGSIVDTGLTINCYKLGIRQDFDLRIGQRFFDFGEDHRDFQLLVGIGPGRLLIETGTQTAKFGF
ncbi:MAG: hypothetical protein MUC94_14470, partial [bacterium]|nr:hypothetical protein [bacterium]